MTQAITKRKMVPSRPRKHLFFALNICGLGEAILGANLAQELQKRGDEVLFLAHDSNARVLEGKFAGVTFTDVASPLLPFYIEGCLKGFQADSLILADHVTTMLTLETLGLGPELLTKLGIPIFAIDTWDSSQGPERIDLFVKGFEKCVPRWQGDVQWMCPAPFLKFNAGTTAYQSLPEGTHMGSRRKRQVRRKLGIGDRDKVVLFSTAQWQHQGSIQIPQSRHPKSKLEWDVESEWAAGARCATMLPELVAHYINKVGKSVHLVHVGPTPYNLKRLLPDRYHWLPPLAPQQFDELLGSADLLLSANISATTVTKAMVLGVPSVVLQNSISAATREEVEAAVPAKLSPALGRWVDRALPLFPFSLWPLGYYRFLAPRMQDNPYRTALEVVDILDEFHCEAVLNQLLHSEETRLDQLSRQNAYLHSVRQLPAGADFVHSVLGTS